MEGEASEGKGRRLPAGNLVRETGRKVSLDRVTAGLKRLVAGHQPARRLGISIEGEI